MTSEARSSVTEEQTAFYRQNVDWLRRLARSRCHDPETADDLVQETFLKLFNSWQTKEKTILTSRQYVATTLVNCYRDAFRRRKARPLDDVNVDDVSEPELIRRGYSTSLPEHDPEVRNALACLPPRQRTLMYLVYYEGFPIAEAATVMGLGPKTAHNYHHSAKKKIELDLSHRAGGPGGAR
jgi:RNA polymerase sigma-70 factor (ECF subfamily)